MKKPLLLGALLLAAATTQAQKFQWAEQVDDGYFSALHANSEETIWATGLNTLARKYSADGSLLKNVPVSGFMTGYGITTDASGNVYMTGCYNSAMTADGKQLETYGMGDVYVIKMDPDGHIAWAERAGSDEYDAGYSILADNDGKSLVAGKFNGTAAFGTQSLTSKGETDLFLARYDADGKVLWAKSSGGMDADPYCSLLRTAQGKLYYYGRYMNSAKLGEIFAPMNDGVVSFILEVNPADGSFSNLQTYPNITITSWKADAQGNLIAGGSFNGALTLGGQTYTGSDNLIFFKLNLAQSQPVQWVKTYGPGEVSDMAVSPDGYVYFCGGFRSTFRISDSKSLVSAGETDAYFAALNNTGEMVWAESAGAEFLDDATCMAMSPSGNRLFSGGDIQAGPVKFGDYSLPGNFSGVSYLTEITTLTTGINEKPASVQARVYPNPAKGTIYLQTPSGSAFHNISLQDLSGRIVWSAPFAAAITHISLPALPSGMYILQAECDGGVVREKVMIEE